jgi:hypothetical protein
LSCDHGDRPHQADCGEISNPITSGLTIGQGRPRHCLKNQGWDGDYEDIIR